MSVIKGEYLRFCEDFKKGLYESYTLIYLQLILKNYKIKLVTFKIKERIRIDMVNILFEKCYYLYTYKSSITVTHYHKDYFGTGMKMNNLHEYGEMNTSILYCNTSMLIAGFYDRLPFLLTKH